MVVCLLTVVDDSASAQGEKDTLGVLYLYVHVSEYADCGRGGDRARPGPRRVHPCPAEDARFQSSVGDESEWWLRNQRTEGA